MSAKMTATILVADDDEDLRRMVAACLAALGYRTLEAADGERAIELVRAERPDLLLLDIWMPGSDGLTVLERLKHDPAADRTSVVLLTNDPEADSRLEALAAGAVGCLAKSGGLDNLQAQVERCLAERREWLEPDGEEGESPEASRLP